MKLIKNKGLLNRLSGFSAALACALMLAACGGGGGDSGSSLASSRYNLSFNTGEWTTIFYGGNDATGYIKLTKTSTESSASPDVSSQTVHLSASVPGAVTLSSAVTNADGEAIVTIMANDGFSGTVTVTATVNISGNEYRASTTLNVNNVVNSSISRSAQVIHDLGKLECGTYKTYFVNVKKDTISTPNSTNSTITVFSETGGAEGVAQLLGEFGILGDVWLIQVMPPVIPICKEDGANQVTGEVMFEVVPDLLATPYYFGYRFIYNVE